MKLSGGQEKVETVMGRASLHCPGEACRGTPRLVAIVSPEENVLF